MKPGDVMSNPFIDAYLRGKVWPLCYRSDNRIDFSTSCSDSKPVAYSWLMPLKRLLIDI
ncbi:hypothetical protein MCEMSHM24_03149 [Comamonadaceae bacterium]